MRTEFSYFRLAFGLLCIVVAIITGIGNVDGYSFDVAWLWVAALSVIGVAGLASVVDTVRRARRPAGVAVDDFGLDDSAPDDDALNDDGPAIDV